MRMLQDLKFALRTFRKNRIRRRGGVRAGANSAMFGDGVLIRPLPFPQSGRLVNLR